jgi:cytochrome P450
MFSFDRVCTSPCDIDGIHFERGDWVQFSAWGIHHCDKYWPEPHKFMPERLGLNEIINNSAQMCSSFLPENKDNIVPYSFIPFGSGPRNCVGMRLAYLEAKIGILHVLKSFRLLRDAKTEVGLHL